MGPFRQACNRRGARSKPLERALCRRHLEFPALFVVDRYHAFTNVVHPSVERKIAVDQPIRNARMRAEVAQLRDHILFSPG